MKEKRSENQKRVADKTKHADKKAPVEEEAKVKKTSKKAPVEEAEVVEKAKKASKKPKKEKKPTDKLADKSGLTIFLQHIFGDAQKRTLRRLAKRVEEINKLGIGPAGLGGKTTALAVNIETYPTHIAGLPLAINMCCHVDRHKTVII